MMKNLTNMSCKFSAKKGFTLVEMAIVLVIIGLFLTLFLSPLSAQKDMLNRDKTKVLFTQAKEALLGYAVVNRHLPCPDTKSVPNGAETRKSDGTCDKASGVLPWNTLGIEPVDAWERYFFYRVDTTFSNSTVLFTLTDANSASGLEINDENGAVTNTESRPVAIVLSFGKNGFGGKNTNQSYPANQISAPSSVDELENVDGNVTFKNRAPSAQGSANEFDDMLVWISPKVLINRMIVAERLP